jgi:hypothetical protein
VTLLVRLLLLLFAMAVILPPAGPPRVDVIELADVVEAAGEEEESSRVPLGGATLTHPARPALVRFDERSPPTPVPPPLFRPPRGAFV